MEADIKAEDRGELVSVMEPLLITDISRQPPGVALDARAIPGEDSVTSAYKITIQQAFKKRERQGSKS